jgi:REP element-mobilizing transposase RayT
MSVQPIYTPAMLRPAFQLRYGWTGWPSRGDFSPALIESLIPKIAAEWEKDGLRVLESRLRPDQIQLTVSTTPQVCPVILAARLKGRLQHHARRAGSPINFSRKIAVRALGNPTRTAVEGYIHNQVASEAWADERFRERLARFTIVDPQVDLARPTETNSGRYWYNLHLVLVVSERYRMENETTLATIRDTVPRIGANKGYAASTFAVMPDHLHLALRGDIEQSPEDIALCFLNNLAFALDQRPWWQAGYYAGTFGEYGMAAVRGS